MYDCVCNAYIYACIVNCALLEMIFFRLDFGGCCCCQNRRRCSDSLIFMLSVDAATVVYRVFFLFSSSLPSFICVFFGWCSFFLCCFACVTMPSIFCSLFFFWEEHVRKISAKYNDSHSTYVCIVYTFQLNSGGWECRSYAFYWLRRIYVRLTVIMYNKYGWKKRFNLSSWLLKLIISQTTCLYWMNKSAWKQADIELK